MPDPPPNALRAVRDETILTGLMAVLHWRVSDSTSRSLDELHWVVHLVSLAEPRVAPRAEEIMARYSEDVKVLVKLEAAQAAVWRALVHDFNKGIELSDAAMKIVVDLGTRLDERRKEVESLVSEASKMRDVRMPPETHLIRPMRWKWMTDFLKRAAAGYARDKLKK